MFYIGDIVKVVNNKNGNFTMKEKYIGQELEVYNITNNYVGGNPKFVFKGIPIEWDEKNLVIVKKASLKESALKVVDNDLKRVRQEIERLKKREEELENMRNEIINK